MQNLKSDFRSGTSRPACALELCRSISREAKEAGIQNRISILVADCLCPADSLKLLQERVLDFSIELDEDHVDQDIFAPCLQVKRQYWSARGSFSSCFAQILER